MLGQTLSYSAWLVPQAADSVLGIDDAMKLGYNWKYGPFELIDKLGAANLVARLKAERDLLKKAAAYFACHPS